MTLLSSWDEWGLVPFWVPVYPQQPEKRAVDSAHISCFSPYLVCICLLGDSLFFFFWNTLRSSPILGLRVLEKGFCLYPEASAGASKH